MNSASEMSKVGQGNDSDGKESPKRQLIFRGIKHSKSAIFRSPHGGSLLTSLFTFLLIWIGLYVQKEKY